MINMGGVLVKVRRPKFYTRCMIIISTIIAGSVYYFLLCAIEEYRRLRRESEREITKLILSFKPTYNHDGKPWQKPGLGWGSEPLYKTIQ
jgi:hypothetical protein